MPLVFLKSSLISFGSYKDIKR